MGQACIACRSRRVRQAEHARPTEPPPIFLSASTRRVPAALLVSTQNPGNRPRACPGQMCRSRGWHRQVLPVALQTQPPPTHDVITSRVPARVAISSASTVALAPCHLQRHPCPSPSVWRNHLDLTPRHRRIIVRARRVHSILRRSASTCTSRAPRWLPRLRL